MTVHAFHPTFVMAVKVAIIGAGPAGLAAFDRLSLYKDLVVPFLFDAGGNLEQRLQDVNMANLINGEGPSS